LTLLGGGAFGNELHWIYDTIWQTHKKYAKVGCGLKKVSLVLFNTRSLLERFPEQLKQNNIPYTRIEYKGNQPTQIDSWSPKNSKI